jgi:hypothetical protein
MFMAMAPKVPGESLGATRHYYEMPATNKRLPALSEFFTAKFRAAAIRKPWRGGTAWC